MTCMVHCPLCLLSSFWSPAVGLSVGQCSPSLEFVGDTVCVCRIYRPSSIFRLLHVLIDLVSYFLFSMCSNILPSDTTLKIRHPSKTIFLFTSSNHLFWCLHIILLTILNIFLQTPGISLHTIWIKWGHESVAWKLRTLSHLSSLFPVCMFAASIYRYM